VTSPLLTADQVAERLGVSKAWVWAQVRADAIPHVRLGRYRRFREEAIEEWLAGLERGGLEGTLSLRDELRGNGPNSTRTRQRNGVPDV
jgi:excisionase family DNA binding protein